jgi:hypothetical protein
MADGVALVGELEEIAIITRGLQVYAALAGVVRLVC